jgi:hypothetical protein
VISIHCLDDYATDWGDARWLFYDTIFSGFPTFVYDGLEDGWPVETYEAKFLARRAIATDVTLALTAFELLDEYHQVDVTVCVEPGGTGKTVRVSVVQTLDHYPSPRGYDRHTVMQGLDGVDVTVAAGACELVSQTIKIDPVSWGLAEEIQLTAWAQEPLPSDPAEVYQAIQLKWPRFLRQIFADGFEDGTTGGWDGWGR